MNLKFTKCNLICILHIGNNTKRKKKNLPDYLMVDAQFVITLLTLTQINICFKTIHASFFVFFCMCERVIYYILTYLEGLISLIAFPICSLCLKEKVQ